MNRPGWFRILKLKAPKPEKAKRSAAGTVRAAAGRFFHCPECDGAVTLASLTPGDDGVSCFTAGQCRKCHKRWAWAVSWEEEALDELTKCGICGRVRNKDMEACPAGCVEQP